MRKLADDMSMSRSSMANLVKAVGLRCKTALIRHEILPGQMERRLARAKKLLAWRRRAQNKNKVILYSDEKQFTVEQYINRKNDRWLLPPGPRGDEVRTFNMRKNPSSIMVFGAVASDGSVIDPIIFPPKTTVSSPTYRDVVLTKVVNFMHERWGPGEAVFQQNGAPAHTSNATQNYLRQQLGKNGFWPKDLWPPSR